MTCSVRQSYYGYNLYYFFLCVLICLWYGYVLRVGYGREVIINGRGMCLILLLLWFLLLRLWYCVRRRISMRRGSSRSIVLLWKPMILYWLLSLLSGMRYRSIRFSKLYVTQQRIYLTTKKWKISIWTKPQILP